jgi:hypothetical protein
MNMVSNEKIYKIAKGLYEYMDIKGLDSPTSVVSLFKNNKSQYTEYLKNFPPETVLKVMIAFWGISRGMTLSEIEFMYEDLFFATVFYTQGYYHEEQCEQCDGSGNEECDYCDGRGESSCDECDGDGNITCGVCDGEGEVEDESGDMVPCSKCDGEGSETCDSCDGEGNKRCDYCYGNGSEECSSCEGSGTLESDYNKDYSVDFIACWRRSFKDKCELEQGTTNPVATIDKFQRSNQIMILASEESDAELEEEVSDNKVYCLEYLGDSAELMLNTLNNLTFRMVGYDDSHLLL